MPRTVATGEPYIPLFLHLAAAPDSGTFLVAWMNGDDDGVRALRLASDGSPLDGGVLVLRGSGGYQDEVAVGSDGRDFLVAWHDPDPGIRAARITWQGAVLDQPGRVIWAGQESATRGRPSITFDGRDWVIGFEVANADGGNNLLVRRLSFDGGLGTAEVFSATSESDERPALAHRPGLLLAAYQRYEPGVDGRRVRVRGALDDTFVPDSGGSGDAGPVDAGSDAGAVADGGSGAATAYAVRCGCGDGSAAAPVLAALAALSRASRRRRPTAATSPSST
jgi:hypothetical protein